METLAYLLIQHLKHDPTEPLTTLELQNTFQNYTQYTDPLFFRL